MKFLKLFTVLLLFFLIILLYEKNSYSQFQFLDNEPASVGEVGQEGSDQPLFFSIDLMAGIAIPMGDFADIAEPGGVLIINGSYNNLIFQNFSAGLETGFIYLTSEQEEIQALYMVPFLASVRYTIPIGWDISVMPQAGIGYSVNMIAEYEYESPGKLSDSAEVESAFEPMFFGGVGFSYEGFDSVSLSLGTRYYGIIEEKALIKFMIAYMGAGIRL